MQTHRQAHLLITAPVGQEDLRDRLLDWFGSLPTPVDFEILGTPQGAQIWAFPAQDFQGPANAFASLTRHAFHWTSAVTPPQSPSVVYVITSNTLLPQVFAQGEDPFLVWAARLREAAQQHGFPLGLRVMVFQADPDTQVQLRALAAYNYGTRSGVSPDEPNPWGLRLTLYKGLAIVGTFVVGGSVAGGIVGWLPLPVVGVLTAAGGISFLAGALGTRRWIQVRNIPRQIMEEYTQTPLYQAAFAFTAYTNSVGAAHAALRSLAEGTPIMLGGQRIIPTTGSEMHRVALTARIPVPASTLTHMLTPPQSGDPAAVMDPETRSDVPAPPPTAALRRGRYRVGVAVATRELVGISMDGHGLISGGSRSGKSSLAAQVLLSLLDDPDPPGVFLIDPHLSLADAWLDAIAQLPEPRRSQAIHRLRIISPDQEEIVPLNLLSLPDHSWAANALVNAGRRIWTDYWGPRMQAAMNALFNLGQAYNMAVPEGQRVSLFHLPFIAFNPDKRREMLHYLPPDRRVIALNLDALLGQFSADGKPWQQGWVTEVISPIISKIMALELSPWLVKAMAHPRFADITQAVQDRAWFVLRAPTGIMGHEGARLLAAIFYNVWESIFRRTATARDPIPYLIVVDEMQEIASGMQLESLLAEGAKFGASIIALTQSLRMLMHIEGFPPVVQALKANTSFQAFFSPDPDDIRDIRTVLSADVRYGEMTLDLPSLHCWLRVRVDQRWQPPTVIRVPHIPPSDPDRVQGLIREVIAAHPDFYSPPTISTDALVNAMLRLVPPHVQTLLGRLVSDDEEEGRIENWNEPEAPPEPPPETEHARRLRRLGL